MELTNHPAVILLGSWVRHGAQMGLAWVLPSGDLEHTFFKGDIKYIMVSIISLFWGD